jgi:hypothetical protein
MEQDTMNRHDRRAQEARTRQENPQAARKAVENDATGVARQLRDLRAIGIDAAVANDQDDTSSYGNGAGVFIPITIGMRGKLTAVAAKEHAEFWCKTIKRHPKGIFHPNILGYDADPRELHEFEDVRRYLRLWARFAAITSPEAIGVEVEAGLVALLAACGCAGFEHIAVTKDDGSQIKPTTEQ